jgi:hypothetical protein
MRRNKTKRKKPKPLPHDEDRTSEKKDTKRHVYVEPGVKIDLVQSLKDEHNAVKEENDAHQKRQLLWTKIASALVLLTCGFTGWQAYTTNESLKLAHTQLVAEERPLEKMEVILNAGTKVAIDFVAGKQISVPVRISNIGKTVGLNEEVNLFVEVLSPSQSPSLTHVGQKHVHEFSSFTGAMFPSVSQEFQVPRIDPHTGKSVFTTTEEAIDLTKYVVVYGTVEYNDTFGVHHWTKFCQPIYLSGAVYNINYNSVDQDR